MNEAKIAEIVREVLDRLDGTQTQAAAQRPAAWEIPKTAHVAVLTGLEHFDIKEYPIPEVGDGWYAMEMIRRDSTRF